MSYYNQRYHERLDRMAIRDYLRDLAGAQVLPAQNGEVPGLAELMRRAESGLERHWLRRLDSHGLRLPSSAQTFVEACRTRPDFLYEDDFVAVYVDGPPHDYEDRQKRDLQLTTCMENLGYTVLRFHHEDDWLETIKKYPHVFGKLPVSA